MHFALFLFLFAQIPTVSSLQAYAGRDYFKDPYQLLHPCTYPKPREDVTGSSQQVSARCNLPNDQVKHFNICDASGIAISYTEAHEISNQLDAISLERVEKTALALNDSIVQPPASSADCVCGDQSIDIHAIDWQYCWYRIGFAFLHRIELPKYELPDGIDADELCATSEQEFESVTQPPIPTPPSETASWSPAMIRKYGNQFAQIVRERWRMGSCGEDILILVVKKRPNQLVQSTKALRPPNSPMLFVSYGDQVRRRITLMDTSDFERAVESANKRFQQGSTMQEVLRRLIASHKALLERADEAAFKPRRTYREMPDWAYWLFVSCGAAVIGMALCLRLVQHPVRRSHAASKAAEEKTGGRWKAGGFFGKMFSKRGEAAESTGPARGAGGGLMLIDYS